MMADTKPLDLYGLRRREVQAIGAAISTRDWWALEQAYNSIRDKLDHAGYSIGSVPPTPKGGLPGRGEASRIVSRIASFMGEQGEREAIVDWLRKVADSKPHGTDWRTYYEIADAIEVETHLAPAEAIRDGAEGGEG